MRSFLVVAGLASVSHARRVQTAIEQPESSEEKSLASMLLAFQAVRSNLNPQGGTRPAHEVVRASPVHMISAANTALAAGGVHHSWYDIGSGDIATQLGKLTGPNVIKMDQATRKMTMANDNFDKFIAAAQSQGVMDLLKGPGPFTLLLPVDSSITKGVDAKAHILQGKYTLDDLSKGGSAQTLAGTTVEYSRPLKIVQVNYASVKGLFNPADHREGKESTAFPFDVECTNGVIHAIDEPLVETNEPIPSTPSAAARGAPAPAARAPAPAGGGAFPVAKDCVWDFHNKKIVFEAWDPEKTRDYNNFNPFERNNEGSQADQNGCFPGQSRGYKSPKRPNMNWDIMQAEKLLIEEIKKHPKYGITGKPGNFKLSWQDNLGPPP
jgi:uncharacterized surface protein with fasciclin (FAS1) repeats